MPRAAKVAGADPDQRRTSARHGARITSDGPLRCKWREQLHELEGNKRLRFQEIVQEESARENNREVTEISLDEGEPEVEVPNSRESSESDIVEIKRLQDNDLRTRIGGFDKKAEMEASDPYAVEEGESYMSELQEELKNTMLSQSLAGSDVRSEEIEPLEAADETQAIEEIAEGAEGSQDEGSATEGDEPPEIDEDRAWQESQVQL
ncbi:hypothetical protein EV426DRAFT_710593 [Tirmania nivea]|nr:hypothetical protein EV426DRAFT_710593 [Tirmania nivea]